MSNSPSPFHFLMAALVSACLIHASTPAFAQWTNSQPAYRVLGQGAFGTADQGTGATSLNRPIGVAVDADRGKLYVADFLNNRVLRFAWPVLTDGPAAELVLGQPGFGSGFVNNPSRVTGMFSPSSVAVDSSGTLYVSDTDNHRILAFENAHLITTHGTTATRVLGQSNLTGGSSAVTATGLADPAQIAWAPPDRLWVADTENSRVLRYEGVSQKANGAAADGVLGKSSFLSNSCGLGTTGLCQPRGVAVFGDTLYVSDSQNHRIVRFDSAAAKPNGGSADGVLGRPNFTTSGSGLTTSGLSFQFHLTTDRSGRLYVADNSANRVIIHNDAAIKTNGADADHVLGQTSYTSNSFGTGDSQMRAPVGVAVDSGSGVLAVVEFTNSRVLLFQAASPLPVSLRGFNLE